MTIDKVRERKDEKAHRRGKGEEKRREEETRKKKRRHKVRRTHGKIKKLALFYNSTLIKGLSPL